MKFAILLLYSLMLSACGVWFCREKTGTKFDFRLVLRDSSGLLDSTVSLYFSTHGDDLFDKEGNIKINHSPVHPPANGTHDFSDYTRNYTSCDSKPGIEDIGPLTILIRGGKYQEDTVMFSGQELQQLKKVDEHYQLPDIVLKPR